MFKRIKELIFQKRIHVERLKYIRAILNRSSINTYEVLKSNYDGESTDLIIKRLD